VRLGLVELPRLEVHAAERGAQLAVGFLLLLLLLLLLRSERLK